MFKPLVVQREIVLFVVGGGSEGERDHSMSNAICQDFLGGGILGTKQLESNHLLPTSLFDKGIQLVLLLTLKLIS